MAQQILTIEYCLLDSIRFDPQNPRLHSMKQVPQIAQGIVCVDIVRRWQSFTGQSAIQESTGRTFNEVEEENYGRAE